MAGTMLDLVRRKVERRYGRATWATLVGAPKAPAADLLGTGDQAAGTVARSAADTPSDALACWLGRQAVARVARDWPELLSRHGNLRAFLLGLDGRTAGPALHGEEHLSLAVRVFESVDGALVVTVDGNGACCALVEGLIAGAADRYEQSARLQLLKCRKRGDNRCVIRVGFDASEAEAEFHLSPLSAERSEVPRIRVV